MSILLPSAWRRCCLAVARAAIGSLLLLLGGGASAQDWPNRAIRLVVPYPAGGAVDIVARALAEKLSLALAQTVVVDNKAGAGGLIGADAVAKAAPDGYTWVMGTVSSHAIAPAVYRKMPYDAEADFTAVSLVALTPYIITVNAAVPVKTLRELVSYAKANPDKLNFGSSGTGTTPHLAGELFNTLAGTKINHVPYKGSAPMVVDLLGGQVQVAFDNTVIPNIKAGKLRGLAVTGPGRLAAVADIPTAAEAGLPAYEAVGWMGLYGPKGLPLAVRNRLAAETAKAAATPDFIAKMESLGFQARTGSPAEFDAYLKSETSKWAKVVKDAGVPQE
ncbi:MAG: tripartite tricarboxylate transporter substrate binding protein [Betaproteobacteria bacterium]